jgi:biopolymer transport protein ExbD
MKYPRNVKIFRGQLDASPFVGVLFLLVLFLLLHSRMVFTPGIPLSLPSSTGWAGATNVTVVVALDRAGQLYFRNQVTGEEELRHNLGLLAEREATPITLVLLADGSVANKTVVNLVTLARDVGIENTLLATRPPTQPILGVPMPSGASSQP